MGFFYLLIYLFKIFKTKNLVIKNKNVNHNKPTSLKMKKTGFQRINEYMN